MTAARIPVMPDLVLHGRRVRTIFDVMGRQENDMTKAMGWVLANCPEFQKGLVREVVPQNYRADDVAVQLQVWQKERGFADVELSAGSTFHVIVEAKRGWQPPEMKQLRKYARRLNDSEAQFKGLVILTDWSYVGEAAAIKAVDSIPVAWLSWARVHELAKAARRKSKLKARLWLTELSAYIGGIATMQQADSNWVYVVSLSEKTPQRWRISFVDVVRQRGLYFHPTKGGGWPKTPPNYLG